jgi:hypothetical protein
LTIAKKWRNFESGSSPEPVPQPQQQATPDLFPSKVVSNRNVRLRARVRCDFARGHCYVPREVAAQLVQKNAADWTGSKQIKLRQRFAQRVPLRGLSAVVGEMLAKAVRRGAPWGRTMLDDIHRLRNGPRNS